VLDQKKITTWLKYTGLTAELLALIGIAVYAGIQLDEKWSVSPLFIICLPLLVLVVTFYKLIKETNKKKINDRQKDK
jgi:F0F1-type ATP synthase assembly protein I